MKREELSKALDQLDPSYIEEAADGPIRRPQSRRWLRAALPLAACLLLVLLSPFIQQKDREGEISGEQSGGAEQSASGIAEPDQGHHGLVGGGNPMPGEPSGESGALTLNEVLGSAGADGTQSNIELLAEDRVPMTTEELLAYYGVSLPVPALLPGFQLVEGQEKGIFRSQNGDVYEDTNQFRFEDAESGRALTVCLSKARHWTGERYELAGPLAFSQVNGRMLAVFLIEGQLCTQWYENGLRWNLTGEGLSPEDYGWVLEALISHGEGKDGQSMTGVLSVIDPGNRMVFIQAGSGPALGVTLPERVDMTGLHLDDSVTVRWRGEPATCLHVWPEQVLEFTVEKGDIP